jgi:hypothetical protein
MSRNTDKKYKGCISYLETFVKIIPLHTLCVDIMVCAQVILQLCDSRETERGGNLKIFQGSQHCKWVESKVDRITLGDFCLHVIFIVVVVIPNWSGFNSSVSHCKTDGAGIKLQRGKY